MRRHGKIIEIKITTESYQQRKDSHQKREENHRKWDVKRKTSKEGHRKGAECYGKREIGQQQPKKAIERE